MAISDSGAPASPLVPDRPGPAARWFVPIVVTLGVIAALIRAWQASRTELWFDEIFTLWVARLPWREMFTAVANDVHPPLHFTIIKLWRSLGGESSLWIKLSSVLPGALTVAALAPIGRRMFGTGAGLIAAALLAFNGTHVLVSQEARFYPWLALWVWLAAGLAWSWVDRPGRRTAIVFVVVEALGLYTHYLSGLAYAFLFLWGLAVLAREPRRIPAWIGLHVVVALLFAPQLPTLVHQVARDTGEHWIRAARPQALLSLSRRLAFSALYLIPLVAVLALVPLFRARQHRAAALVWIVTLPPVLLTFMLTHAGAHLFTERYMYWVIPGFCLLYGAALASIRPAWLAAVLTGALMVQGVRTITGPAFGEARELAVATRYLEAHVAAGDQVLCVDTHSLTYIRQHGTRLPGAWLLWPTARVPYYDGALVIPGAWYRPPAALDSLTAAHTRWWGVRARRGDQDPHAADWRFIAAGGTPALQLSAIAVWRGPLPDSAAAESLAR